MGCNSPLLYRLAFVFEAEVLSEEFALRLSQCVSYFRQHCRFGRSETRRQE